MLRRLPVLSAVVALGSAVPVVMALVGRRAPWWCDLGSPFVLHAVIGGVLALAGALWARERAVAVIAGATALAAAVLALPLWLTPTGSAGAGERLEIMHLNLNTANPSTAAIVSQVSGSSADLAVIVELSFPMARALESLPAPWRPLVVRPSRDNFGIGVYSRQAVTATRARMLGEVFPAIEVVIDDRVILAVHAMPPIDREATTIHRAHLAELAAWVRDEPRPTIVVGDLNATIWSASLLPLTDAGLRSAALGHGHRGTWPAPLGPAGIMIDHVLIPSSVIAETVEVLPIEGSDHRGLRVVLAPE